MPHTEECRARILKAIMDDPVEVTELTRGSVGERGRHISRQVQEANGLDPYRLFERVDPPCDLRPRKILGHCASTRAPRMRETLSMAVGGIRATLVTPV